MSRLSKQLIREKVEEIRKHKFFDPTYDPVFKKIFRNKTNLMHFLNAVLHLEGENRIKSVGHLKPAIKMRNLAGKEKKILFDIHARTADGRFIDIEMQRATQEDFLDRIELYSTLLSVNAKLSLDAQASKKQREDHPYLMPTVYSIWICNFPVPFCREFHEELALFRTSDVGNSHPLTIYPKKRYIIIDLTKYIPTETTSPENQWIELFRNLPTAKAIPRGIDKDEFNACMSYARREGYEEGEAKGEARAKRKFAARDKKIAEFLKANGVSLKVLNAAMAIK